MKGARIAISDDCLIDEQSRVGVVAFLVFDAGVSSRDNIIPRDIEITC